MEVGSISEQREQQEKGSENVFHRMDWVVFEKELNQLGI
jgi:hypothetical protein